MQHVTFDFEEFFAENYETVERAVSVAVGNRDRAEELTQEAFARAYRRWRHVSGMERPVAWLYVVALNTERKRWRREQRTPDTAAPDADQTDHADPVVDAIVLRDAITALPSRQRTVITLRYLADLTTAETAAAMGCAQGTVKATLHQALKSLRIDLGAEP
jgi:RNA polymerase sigma-70 factor (ECF subfamily)